MAEKVAKGLLDRAMVAYLEWGTRLAQMGYPMIT